MVEGSDRDGVHLKISSLLTIATGIPDDHDFSTTNITSDCFVLLQVHNGEFVRVEPAERGTLACGTDSVISITADPDAFETDT